jgi:aspartyl-tRNA(Asn)/glutamyl-tRNA(Gln) amidotransferase subunit B
MPTTHKKYQPIIGLEIHVELKTQSKMFCACSAPHFGIEPNSHCCPVCLGLPGALPVANHEAIKKTVLTGLALNCSIPNFSKFDRKNYFYPDLPKGYQISQYDFPLAKNGQLNSIRIRRVHLEEDTAKLIHDSPAGENLTLIDFNRSGVPLMEIVTEPDIRSASKAKEFLQQLQQVIRLIGVSDADMEKGSLRLEVNISLAEVKSKAKPQIPKYKIEIKNLNSFRYVEKAIIYEIKRQEQILKTSHIPVQETRGWDEKKQQTFTQRVKEEAQDYRYFPEPDLPPIYWRSKEIAKIRARLKHKLASQETANDFGQKYHLLPREAKIIFRHPQKKAFFLASVDFAKKESLPLKQIANLLINRPLLMKGFTPANLINYLLKQKSVAKINEQDLVQVIKRVIEHESTAVKDYRRGKKNALEFLFGQVFKKINGRADPKTVRSLLIKALTK